MQPKFYEYNIYCDDVHITNILSVESKMINLPTCSHNCFQIFHRINIMTSNNQNY